MEVTLLLCDAAQEVGGKLYVLGGGWSVIRADNPTNMSLAIKLSVPWDQTNEKHQLHLRLLDADGQTIESDEGSLEATGELEVGRPPGLKPGTPLDAPLVINFFGVSVGAGSYVWDLEVDGTSMARAPFTAVS